MKLFTRPGTCSLATNISLHEAGIPFEMVKVSRHTGKTSDGVDFIEINSKGYVPALLLDNGELLTENAALLQTSRTSTRRRNWRPLSGRSSGIG